jgi:hypothetical protein
MNLREYTVLEVLNIASTIYQRDGQFQASAVEMVEVFNTDRRFEAERRIMGFSVRSMGGSLGRLAGGKNAWPVRSQPLVERVGSRRWKLTRAGVGVLNA